MSASTKLGKTLIGALAGICGAGAVAAEDGVEGKDGRFSAGLGVFTLVEPANDNGWLAGLGRVEAGSSKRPTFIFNYRWRPRVAVELMVGYPFKHSLQLSRLGNFATVRQFPVALTAQYHFINRSRFTPFLGAGLGYIEPFDAFPRNFLQERDLDFSGDLGVTLQAGLDVRITDRHGARLDVRYFDTNFDTTLDGQAIGSTSFSPTFYSLSYIYTF